MTKDFKARPVTLKPGSPSMRCLPGSMLEHITSGGRLFLVNEPGDRAAFVSTHENPNGHLCTNVATADLIELA